MFLFEVGGGTLDSHHGFVVEYGIDRDVELGFHVDDSEVTLNVCLGKQFSGGELFFRGIRCDKHVNTETQSEEIFDYFHVPGHAVLHRGRHRHGARATTSGRRVNLLLWCRRELKKYQKDFSSWCGECQREKRERQLISIDATKQGSEQPKPNTIVLSHDWRDCRTRRGSGKCMKEQYPMLPQYLKERYWQ
ncbi:putative PKHD-type hydroxylase, partial [Cucurbita argyrosperma subsp. argyrosperma]